MSGLLDAWLIGAGLSVLAALTVWLAGRGLRHRFAGAEVSLWRAARWVALLPLVLAPLIYLVPQAPIVFEGGGLELGPARTFADPVPATGLLAPPAVRFDLPVRDALALAYLAGLVLMLGLCALRHAARRNWLRRCREASREERRPLEAMAERLGIRAPEMRVGPADISPFLTGWRGVVVMPEAGGMTPSARHYALAHELSHLRRGDERDRLIGAALVTLNWFNWPFRQIERELNAAREMACDRDTLTALGGAQRKAYAAALIDMMRTSAPTVSAFGPTNRRLREMRIQAIMTQTAAKKGRALWLAATVLATAVPLASAQALVTERRPADSAEIVRLDTRVRSAEAPVTPVGEQRVRARAPQGEPLSVVVSEPYPAPVPVRALEPASEPASEVVPAPVVEPLPVVAPASPQLTHPVVEGRITSRYGERPARPAGAPIFHHGYDIAVQRGTPVAAPGEGVVVHAAAGYRGSEAWGNTIAIDHGQGWQTVYAHLEGFDVQVGDRVSAGDQIGRVGATGRVTGPHVHVELHHNGERVDPTGQVPGLD